MVFLIYTCSMPYRSLVLLWWIPRIVGEHFVFIYCTRQCKHVVTQLRKHLFYHQILFTSNTQLAEMATDECQKLSTNPENSYIVSLVPGNVTILNHILLTNNMMKMKKKFKATSDNCFFCFRARYLYVFTITFLSFVKKSESQTHVLLVTTSIPKNM